MLGGAILAAATPPSGAPPAAGQERTAGHRPAYTLLDPSLALPPLSTLVPDLTALPPTPGDADAPPTPDDGNAMAWQLAYRRAQLGALPGADLRLDPVTGFARQLDTDVLSLGMSWRLAGSRVGLAYQLQSARGSDDAGLARFMPGSEAATHALSLGVTREFGASPPAPAPPPLLVPPDPLPSATPPSTVAAVTPSPGP